MPASSPFKLWTSRDKAGDPRLAVTRPVEQLGAAMTADIHECAELVVLAPHHDDRILHQVQRYEIAGLLHLVDVAGELPGRAEQRLVFQLVQLGIAIGPGRQGARRLRRGGLRRHRVEDDRGMLGHGRCSVSQMSSMLNRKPD